MQQENIQESEQMSAKDRAGAIAVAIVCFGLCFAMLTWPEIQLWDNPDPVSRRAHEAQFYMRVIEWLWSRPVGIGLAIFGLLALLSAVSPGKKSEAG